MESLSFEMRSRLSSLRRESRSEGVTVQNAQTPGDWVTGKATYQVEPEVGGDHLVLLVLSQQKEATR